LTGPVGAYTLITVTPDVRSQRRAQAAKMGATCACFNVRKAARAVTQLYDDMLRPTGLRATQLTLLMLLRGHGLMGINRLAEAAVTDRTTLTRNLAILEEQELVRVRPGEDARTRLVELTDAGETAMDAAVPLWQKAQSLIATRMGRDGLTRLLTELSAAVGAATEGGRR
jgi:DNA-binding MarR family transcriptional regulator